MPLFALLYVIYMFYVVYPMSLPFKSPPYDLSCAAVVYHRLVLSIVYLPL